MDKETRNRIQRATQAARRLLEQECAAQLEGVFDVLPDGTIKPEPGAHLGDAERITRAKIVAAIEHRRASGMPKAASVADYTREAAFTILNRFVALKMLEARGLILESVSRGEQSSGFSELGRLAPGLADLPDHGYRLYLECLFDELGREIGVLFDRRDPASLLWPRRQSFTDLLAILNDPDLAGVWQEDETIGWVYQYFNTDRDREQARYDDKGRPKAPQNSYELAVRNQFFTPRYVVQFLTDNTLGRMWCEMRQARTRLADSLEYMVRRPTEVFLEDGEKPPADESPDDNALSQEERLKKPQYVRFRPKKDPRDLRILDPACGSGHFLLYAFDLLLTIYEEAWGDEGSPRSALTGRTLREDWPARAELRRALPGLILRHNLHGIEIDPRCAQIAAFALWMRAQRAFNDFGIPRAERPMITKTNVVIAEPMPGEKDLLEDFLRELREDRLEGLIRDALAIPPEKTVRATKAMADSLADLVRAVWNGMEFAGELGSLLKIELRLQHVIADGQKDWEERLPLFHVLEYGLGGETKQKLVRFVEGRDQDFWSKAEQLALHALRLYAVNQSHNGKIITRRLFAEDTERGFALVDSLRRRYDVLLMNPPFGAVPLGAKASFDALYPRSKADLYAAFVDKALDLLHADGRVGVISSRSGFFLTSFTKWRETLLLRDFALEAVADLGYGVLEAKVETAAYCLRSAADPRPPISAEYACLLQAQPSVFIRCLSLQDKGMFLATVLRSIGIGQLRDHVYLPRPREFRQVPGSPIAYDTPPPVRQIFATYPRFANENRTVKAGVQTSDDFRFLRTWWEVPENELLKITDIWGHSSDLLGFQKACRQRTNHMRWCSFAKWGQYSPYYAELPLVINWSHDGHEAKAFAERTPGTKHWSRRMPASEFYFLPGLSYLARTSIRLCVFPLPAGSLFSNEAGPGIFVRNDERAVALGRLNSLTVERLVSLFQPRGTAGDDQTKKYMVGTLQQIPWPDYGGDEQASAVLEIAEEVQKLRARDERSRRFIGAFDNSVDADRRCAEKMWRYETEVAEAYGLDPLENACSVFGSECDVPNILDELCRTLNIGNGRHGSVATMMSYFIGIIFERWRHAPLKEDHPADLFGPLPELPPAMIGSGFGDAISSCVGILVDDPGHQHDLAGVLTRVTTGGLAGIASCRSEFRTGGPAGEISRSFITTQFFNFHLKHYSVAQRRSPIYWQLSTLSGGYAVWLYYHRLSKDTFYTILSDYLGPKLQHEERRLAALIAEGGSAPNAAQRKQIAEQETLVSELRTFGEEIARVAPLWSPDLNDGVAINFAPLWRLVPQHRAWQRECKDCWDKLLGGDYDWSHLAMHLWPERVVPKCADDRSLAIAHGLEDVFWFEDTDGKWKPHRGPTRPVDELVRERSSAAVKAALKSLLEAPAANGDSRRALRRASR